MLQTVFEIQLSHMSPEQPWMARSESQASHAGKSKKETREVQGQQFDMVMFRTNVSGASINV